MLASLLGLVLGDLLSIFLFDSNPGYLQLAFPIGSQRIVTWQSAAIAAGVGLLAACVGVLTPLREIWSRSSRVPGDPEHQPLSRWALAALAGGLVCLGATTFILIAAPQSAVLGSVTLVIALVLLLPLLLDAMIAAFDRLRQLLGSGAASLAVAELQSPTTRMRSIAIAATGAIAVFGIVAIQGARGNLQHGLNRLLHDLTATTAIWVLPPGPQNLLATAPFQSDAAAKLARLPGVQTVGTYRGDFLDYGDRRLWVLAPPLTAHNPIPPSQIVAGSLSVASMRLRQGGWAILTQAVAADHGLRIGERFTLPAPHPATLRIAALITNLGWPPGAVIVNPADYVHSWGSANPSAYNITLRRGASPGQVATWTNSPTRRRANSRPPTTSKAP